MKHLFAFLVGLTLNSTVMAYDLAIASKGSGQLSLYSQDTNNVTNVSVGYLPHEVAVNATHAFVSNYGHQHVRSTSLKNIPGNTLSIVDLSNPLNVQEIGLGSSPCAPHGIESSPDGKYVFVTCEGRQEIAMVDTESKKLVKTLRTNQPGSHMLTMGKNDRLFITNFWIGTVSVINTKTGKLIKQINTGRTTEGIGLSPDGHHLYVTVVEESEILKISTHSLEIEKRQKLAKNSSPIRVLVSNDNSKLIVNLTGNNSTAIYDSNTLSLIKEIPVGKQPIGLAVSRTENLAFTANMNDGSVSVIDLSTNQLIETLNLGLQLPDGLVVVE